MEVSSKCSRLLEEHRYINVEHHEWWDCVYEDFTDRMKAVGIHVYKMYFSGFYSQGDGACFEGQLDDTLTYLDHHHKDAYPMIRKLLEADGEVYINCKHRGHYYHENCTSFWVDANTLTSMIDQPTEFHEHVVESWQRLLDAELVDFEAAVTQQWRVYMQELYRDLEKTYDCLTSDGEVWDTIVANELDEDDDEEEDKLEGDTHG
jgi:hypothetical protein